MGTELVRLKREKEVAEMCNFSQEEVSQFREIFTEFGEGSTGEVTIVEVRKILRALNMKLDSVQYERLKEIVSECETAGGQGGCKFPEFLTLMKKLMDVNFADINNAARTTLHKAGMLP